MSITNFINSETGTIVQGVNGIRLCQESWMTERARKRNEHSEPSKKSGRGVQQESSGCVTDKDLSVLI